MLCEHAPRLVYATLSFRGIGIFSSRRSSSARKMRSSKAGGGSVFFAGLQPPFLSTVSGVALTLALAVLTRALESGGSD